MKKHVIAGINDAATTDPERSKMFADPEVGKQVTRSSGKKAWFACPNDASHPNWESQVCNVVAAGRGCAVCSGNRCVTGINDAATTDPERSKMFVDRGLATRVKRGSNKRTSFQCLRSELHPRWTASVQSVIAIGSDCPTCSGRRCVTGINDAATTDPERSMMFADPEVAKTVKRNSNKKAMFRCLEELSHPNWEARVYNVVGQGGCCPSCATSGFDPSKPGTLYILDATTHIVFGITGNLDQRLKNYDDSRVLLHRFDFDDGGEARRIESAIKRKFKGCHYGESDLPGEVSESLILDCLDGLLTFIGDEAAQ